MEYYLIISGGALVTLLIISQLASFYRDWRCSQVGITHARSVRMPDRWQLNEKFKLIAKQLPKKGLDEDDLGRLYSELREEEVYVG